MKEALEKTLISNEENVGLLPLPEIAQIEDTQFKASGKDQFDFSKFGNETK